MKKAKFGHKQFQKGQILKNEKRPNKGQISLKKFVKRTNLEFHKMLEICSDHDLKYTIFVNIQKWPNGQTI